MASGGADPRAVLSVPPSEMIFMQVCAQRVVWSKLCTCMEELWTERFSLLTSHFASTRAFVCWVWDVYIIGTGEWKYVSTDGRVAVIATVSYFYLLF